MEGNDLMFTLEIFTSNIFTLHGCGRLHLEGWFLLKTIKVHREEDIVQINNRPKITRNIKLQYFIEYLV